VHRPLLLLPILLSLPVARVCAQNIAEGYADSAQALPAAASLPVVMPDGTAWFDGSDVVWNENGQPPRSLLHFSPPRFGGFALPLPNHGLLFADSSVGEIWLLSTVAGATPLQLATTALPYDAVLLSPTLAIVSAKSHGFGAADNDLLQLDLVSGALAPLGSVPGASGPVEVDAQGGLIYATASAAFPPPPGSVQVLRWTSVQVAIAALGAVPLDVNNAQVLFAGIDSASDIALDVDDDLLFVDWMRGRIGELNDLHAVPWRTDLADYASAAFGPDTLQYVPGAGEFEPFAAAGGQLYVHETDFATVSQLRTIAPRPASIACTAGAVVPRGPFAIDVQQGPRSGASLFALAIAQTPSPLVLAVPGFEQPLHWDAALLGGASLFGAFDAQGRARLALANPGLPNGLQVIVACAFIDSAAAVIGSTAVLPLRLAP
jgi:hypothetical protein